MDRIISAGRLSTEQTAHLGTLLGPIRYIHIGPLLIAVKVRGRNWTKDDTDYVPKLVETLAPALVANPDWHLRSAASLLADNPEADLTGSYFDRSIGRRGNVRDYITEGAGAIIHYTNADYSPGETNKFARGLLYELLIPDGVYGEATRASVPTDESTQDDIAGRTGEAFA